MKTLKWTILLTMMMLVISGCNLFEGSINAADSLSEPVFTATSVPTQSPDATQTPVPTETPVPTALPTETPIPTPFGLLEDDNFHFDFGGPGFPPDQVEDAFDPFVNTFYNSDGVVEHQITETGPRITVSTGNTWGYYVKNGVDYFYNDPRYVEGTITLLDQGSPSGTHGVVCRYNENGFYEGIYDPSGSLFLHLFTNTGGYQLLGSAGVPRGGPGDTSRIGLFCDEDRLSVFWGRPGEHDYQLFMSTTNSTHPEGTVGFGTGGWSPGGTDIEMRQFLSYDPELANRLLEEAGWVDGP